MSEGDTVHYDGAGDGQCLAIKASDGERCTNGVYGSNEFCGHHIRASDVTTAVEESDRDATDWFSCRECGWQPVDYERGGGGPPFCSWCGIELPPGSERYADTDTVRSGGDVDGE